MTMSTVNPGVLFDTHATEKPARSPEKTAFAGVFIFLALWALSTFTFGLPGFYIPAVAMVPIIWAVLITITMGK